MLTYWADDDDHDNDDDAEPETLTPTPNSIALARGQMSRGGANDRWRDTRWLVMAFNQLSSAGATARTSR